MSLKEYNRHATLGPMAGPATSAAAAAGQAAHDRAREPGAAGEGAPKPALHASILILAVFAGAFAVAVAGALLLPEDGIAAGAALLSGLGFAIFGMIMGIEAAKYALAWLILGWGWILGAALAAFVFASFHFYALGPLSEWMVALVASALGLAVLGEGHVMRARRRSLP